MTPSQPRSPLPPSRRGRLAALALGLTVSAAAALALAGGSPPGAGSVPAVPLPLAGAALPSFAPMAERMAPTVVSIAVVQRVRLDPRAMPLPFFFFGDPRGGTPMPREFENRGSGSGVVIDAEGLILTNAHVVKDAAEVTVQLHGGEQVAAEVVGLDEPTDLALLRVRTGARLTAASFGDSDAVRVGDWVVAVGNPFGLEHTVTAGIVSATERRHAGGGLPYANFLQTDASINPGNSGGPLFNLDGEVVGINTAINAAGQGIGFAIPANMARRIAEQLRTAGRVERSWLGVTIQTVTPELAQSFGLSGRPRGALVAAVNEGSPAARAGLRAGDIILRFGDDDIGDSSELPWLASTAGVGSTAVVQVLRDRSKRDVRLTLEAMPAEDDRPSPAPTADDDPAPPGLGISVGAVPDALRRRLDLPEGGALVERVDPRGAAADYGLRPGDLILEVDGRAVERPEAVAAAVADREAGTVIRLRVRSAEGTRFVGIRLR